MTDEQIIKAADICRTGKCSGCPYHELYTAGCVTELIKDVFGFINRKKAENERLLQKLQQAKSEAIKEFAERLTTKIMNHVVYKNDCHNFSGNPEYLIRMVTVCNYITDLVEEMTGEEK